MVGTSSTAPNITIIMPHNILIWDLKYILVKKIMESIRISILHKGDPESDFANIAHSESHQQGQFGQQKWGDGGGVAPPIQDPHLEYPWFASGKAKQDFADITQRNSSDSTNLGLKIGGHGQWGLGPQTESPPPLFRSEPGTGSYNRISLTEYMWTDP